MQRTMADAILEAYRAIKHNIPEDADGSTITPLLVNFRLRDVRGLERTIENMDRMERHTTNA